MRRLSVTRYRPVGSMGHGFRSAAVFSRGLISKSAVLQFSIALLVATALFVGIAAAQDDSPDSTVAPTSDSVAPSTDDSPTDEVGGVTVLEINGLIDPVLVDFISRSLDEAEASDPPTLALLLQIDSPGAVVDDDVIAALADRIAASPVAVVGWVGPSGAEMRGATAQLGASFDVIGLSPNSSIGEIGPTMVDADRLADSYGGQVARIRDRSFGYGDLPDRELVNAEPTFGIAIQSPTIGDFLVGLDGVVTEEVISPGLGPDGGDLIQLQPVNRVRFSAPSLLDQTFHSMASPAVAYLLFIIGLALLLFEFYTAGVGVAGVIGAGFFLGGSYGLSVLPTRWWAIALIVASVVAYAVDVQTGVPRFWTFAGTTMFIVGSLTLYDGVSLPWLTLVVGIVGMLLAMINGMPAMVRTRFSTPTIGREWMVGELGEAVDDVDPEGTVRVRDSVWRARTNRATPILAGEQLEVVEVDGLLLEVAPLEGAAEDYRERARKPKTDAPVIDAKQ